MTDTRLEEITERIRERSAASRSAYLDTLSRAAEEGPNRGALACGNLAHAVAACPVADKARITGGAEVNIAIVTAYNDMLSAHQPYATVPDLLKAEINSLGGTAQVAGGVPAMCDGVTQGRAGMELSLFSRDVIAMATAIALAHDMFDGGLYLGICDKIVPGLLIGALQFGHLPAVFVPSGPMPTGLPNAEKARVRQEYAAGEVGREELMTAENASYHAPGTCTFYGTANSNQMLMELMGLQLPGSSFVPPNTDLRQALHRAAASTVAGLAAEDGAPRGVGHLVNEKSIVNAMVGLLATGGSTNHTLHLPAIAAAAGVHITWQDFSDLSEFVPLLARIYPNGLADINDFQAAGGMSCLIAGLLEAGLVHGDVASVFGSTLQDYTQAPGLDGDAATWSRGPEKSTNEQVLRGADKPFSADGGLRILNGNLGQAVIKTSAVKAQHRVVEAPARVFDSQDAFVAAFEAGEMTGDLIAVIRFQGPQANGMPELHKLTPYLGVLQDKGFSVGLVTDGRMSGASGKVPAAIHVTPEALCGGALAMVRDGDMIRLDAEAGELVLAVDAASLAARAPAEPPAEQFSMGRNLFAALRRSVGAAASGATIFPFLDGETG
jgi:phosphogluconate dehydratase